MHNDPDQVRNDWETMKDRQFISKYKTSYNTAVKFLWERPIKERTIKDKWYEWIDRELLHNAMKKYNVKATDIFRLLKEYTFSEILQWRKVWSRIVPKDLYIIY